jgi:hypothetical protein
MVKFAQTVRQRRSRAVTLFRLKFRRFGEMIRIGECFERQVVMFSNQGKPSNYWAFSLLQIASREDHGSAATSVFSESRFEAEVTVVRVLYFELEAMSLQPFHKRVRTHRRAVE